MKLSAVTLSALLGFGLNVAGQLSVVTGVLSTIDSKTNALNAAINAYTGGPDVSALQAASNALVSATNAGIATVKASAPLSETDALGLTAPATTLTNDVNTSIQDLMGKKSLLVAACQGGQVLSDLNQQKTAAGQLSDAITSKVPAALQGIASQLSSGITAAIQKGIADFQGTACTSTSSAAPTSSAASSSSAPATQSSSSAGVTASSTVPSSGASGPTGVSPSTSSSVPTFTGAASVNAVNVPAGLFAALAAVLAL